MNRRVLSVMLALLLLLVLCVPVSAASDDSNIILDAIGGFFTGLLDGLKSLFIPSKAYLQMFREDIAQRFDAKFSGISASIHYLRDRFGNLRGYRDLEGIFQVEFPQNSILHGISVDFLTSALPVWSFIRFCVTCFVALLTAMLCYRKIIALVNR